MQEIKVTTIVENCVRGRGLHAEHGLSILFEAGGKRILFDTGSSDMFIHNSRMLGINIEDIDTLVLSHGHSDHTGGLKTFLSVNSRAKVVCKKEILIPKYRGERNNGIVSPELLDLNRFEFVESVVNIAEGIYVCPDIAVENRQDTHFANFELLINGIRTGDEFNDELYIVVTKEREFSIFTACSHRGVTNIISSARKQFNGMKLKHLVGGFHLSEETDDTVDFIAEYLKDDMPQKIGVCHCTGVDKYARLVAKLGAENLFYNHCGCQIVL